jgi:hypothetical protein
MHKRLKDCLAMSGSEFRIKLFCSTTSCTSNSSSCLLHMYYHSDAQAVNLQVNYEY